MVTIWSMCLFELDRFLFSNSGNEAVERQNFRFCGFHKTLHENSKFCPSTASFPEFENKNRSSSKRRIDHIVTIFPFEAYFVRENSRRRSLVALGFWKPRYPPLTAALPYARPRRGSVHRRGARAVRARRHEDDGFAWRRIRPCIAAAVHGALRAAARRCRARARRRHAA